MFLESSKTGLISSFQELQLVVILLNDIFAVDDASKPFLFFTIFEPGKNSRKYLLLKFILTAIAMKSSAALNVAGTYLLDPSISDFRNAAEFGQLLIQEITFYLNGSVDKLKSLPAESPIFTNALCLIFAENYMNDQTPPPLIGNLLVEFIEVMPPSFVFTFTIPSHVDSGSLILAAFFRWSVLNELKDLKPSYSHFHLKVIECIASIDPLLKAKPTVRTENLENIADSILKLKNAVDDGKVQKSLLKFAQIVQVSKKFMQGNLTVFREKLKLLPKNSLMDMVLNTL